MTKPCRPWIFAVSSLAAALSSWATVPLWAAPPATSAASGGSAVRPADPLAGVEDLILEGRHAEAQAAAREAQRAFGLRQDRYREALSLLVLAAAELGAG